MKKNVVVYDDIYPEEEPIIIRIEEFVKAIVRNGTI